MVNLSYRIGYRFVVVLSLTLILLTACSSAQSTQARTLKIGKISETPRLDVTRACLKAGLAERDDVEGTTVTYF